MIKLKNVINKHKSNKIKENSNTVRRLNNGTDHRHSKSCCDQSSPARRTITPITCISNMNSVQWLGWLPEKLSFIKLAATKINKRINVSLCVYNQFKYCELSSGSNFNSIYQIWQICTDLPSYDMVNYDHIGYSFHISEQHIQGSFCICAQPIRDNVTL